MGGPAKKGPRHNLDFLRTCTIGPVNPNQYVRWYREYAKEASFH